MSIVFSTRGSGYTNVVQYWNGSTWVTLLNTTHYLVDNTNSFAGSGTITWNVSKISDWATTAVNANTLYWIRISTTTTPVTVAQVNYLIPNSNVIGLLALSSSDVIASNWKWCSYGSNIYATIPNTGNAYYEGNSYITSLSTTTNLQNFFRYNNSFTADYQDSTYVSSVATVIRSATKYILSFTDSSIASGNILVITHNIGQKFVHVQIYDNNGNKVEPDLIQLINSNVCYVTMGSFRTLSGTWTAVVM